MQLSRIFHVAAPISNSASKSTSNLSHLSVTLLCDTPLCLRHAAAPTECLHQPRPACDQPHEFKLIFLRLSSSHCPFFTFHHYCSPRPLAQDLISFCCPLDTRWTFSTFVSTVQRHSQRCVSCAALQPIPMCSSSFGSIFLSAPNSVSLLALAAAHRRVSRVCYLQRTTTMRCSTHWFRAPAWVRASLQSACRRFSHVSVRCPSPSSPHLLHQPTHLSHSTNDRHSHLLFKRTYRSQRVSQVARQVGDLCIGVSSLIIYARWC